MLVASIYSQFVTWTYFRKQVSCKFLVSICYRSQASWHASGEAEQTGETWSPSEVSLMLNQIQTALVLHSINNFSFPFAYIANWNKII